MKEDYLFSKLKDNERVLIEDISIKRDKNKQDVEENPMTIFELFINYLLAFMFWFLLIVLLCKLVGL